MLRVILGGSTSLRRLHLLLVGLVWLLSSHSALAESKQVRLALVIGNSAYANPDEGLPGASADSKDIVDALEKHQFFVRAEANLSRQEMMNAVQQFKEKLAAAGSNTIGFFYYAGHGGADRGNSDNFLLPVDAEVKDVATGGLSVRWIQTELQQLNRSADHPAAVVVVIDACRTLGARGAKQTSGSQGRPVISPMTKVGEPEQGFLFAFSTSKNQTASDKGHYAHELITQMSRKGLTLEGVFKEVQHEVYRKTGQFPIYQPSIVARICLVSCESDIRGAFAQNQLLLTDTQKEAEASLKRIEAMDVQNRCRPGWDSAVVLYESAKKHATDGNLDTAGETYRAVTQRALSIQSYLSMVTNIAGVNKKLEALREMGGIRDKESERSLYISPYRGLFKGLLGSLENVEKTTGRRIDWSQLHQIEAEMEAFANAENYLDATERAIEGHNVALATLERVFGQHVGTPIPKEDRLQGFKKLRESRRGSVGIGMDQMWALENSPAALACK